ncbi:right-handed parallel beta-helix repeat-containing protein [uncultured Hymenobacter sp.]|uniref:right-handed parallel beta-helix repeat-containing protein n=1 Tax=uncultured Hymenobacter sp. TaxID=170016 RepID=UPI0035CB704E
MRFLLPLLLVSFALLSLLSGCEPKENLLGDTGQLEFKAPYLNGNFLDSRADTVLFDTVFTRVGTVTRRLWVYNRNARAVRISQIALSEPATSAYSLIINGDEVQTAAGLELRGQDSLLILVKARLGETSADRPFLLTDELKFTTNGNEQTVKLVAYGQNAYFHANETIGCDEVWRADRPHVLFGTALVGAGCTLRILPGARIYAHAGATLRVRGTLLVNEPADFSPTDTVKLTDRNIVRFEGDRREAPYADVPGQWLGIVLDAESRGSRLRYCEIKNSVYGVLLLNPENRQPQPDVTLTNCVLRNISGANVSAANPIASAGAGVFSLAGRVAATNCLFTNCGQFAILGLGGTTCSLNFCTVANYAPTSSRETESLTFTNELLERPDGTTPVAPFQLTIRNSIIWGPTPSGGAKALEDELLLVNADKSPPVIERTLLRTKLYAAAPGSPAKPSLDNNGNLLNQDPKFRRSPENYSGLVFDYGLEATSPARDQGQYSPQVSHDLLNVPRDLQKPDLGAFERKD